MKPTLKNCPLCGKLFTDTGLGLCVTCYQEKEALEKRVTDYVRENPNTTINKIVEETGVDIKIVKEMVRRGQFITMGGNVTYPCSRCGKLINDGLYCPECLGILRQEIKTTSDRMLAIKNAKSAKEAEREYNRRHKPKIHWTTNPGAN